jgi:hypothetical protein
VSCNWCGNPSLCCVQPGLIPLVVTLALFDSGFNGKPDLSNVDPPTLAVDAIYARCFQVKDIHDRLKETGHLPRWQAYTVLIL